MTKQKKSTRGDKKFCDMVGIPPKLRKYSRQYATMAHRPSEKAERRNRNKLKAAAANALQPYNLAVQGDSVVEVPVSYTEGPEAETIPPIRESIEAISETTDAFSRNDEP